MRAPKVVLTAVVVAFASASAPFAVAAGRTVAMSDGLAALKARDHLAIQRRLDVLAGLTRRVNAATHLTSSDRDTLIGQFSAADGGLRALDSKIQSDTTLADVRADQRKIVDDYHIYVLVVPKTHIVIAADRISYIAGEFSPLVTRLQAAIDKAKADGKKTAAAQEALDDLKTKVQAATDAVSGVPGRVLPLTAAGYPGNRSTLLGARADLVTARTDLRAARADALRVITDLS